MDNYTSTLSPDNLGANVISLLQGTVCDILNADTQLSKVVSFLPENIKDIDSQVKTALGRQGMVATVMTPNVSYQGRKEQVAYYDFEDAEIDVVENPVVNRASNRKAEDFASAQDTALRAIYVLENSDLGDFNVKNVTSGEYDGLLVTKVTFDAFARLAPEGPAPEPEWKSGIKITQMSGVFSAATYYPSIVVGTVDPDYQTFMKATAVDADTGAEETHVIDLAERSGQSFSLDPVFSTKRASAFYFYEIGQPGCVQIRGFDTVLTGRLSKSITKQLSTSTAADKFSHLFLASSTGHGFRLDNLVLDAEVVTPRCYSELFYGDPRGGVTSGSYFEGDNSLTVELRSNATMANAYMFMLCKAQADATLEITVRYEGPGTAYCNRAQTYAFYKADSTLASAVKKASIFFTGTSYCSADAATVLSADAAFKSAVSSYKAFSLMLTSTTGVEVHLPAYAKQFPSTFYSTSGTSTTFVFDL